MSDFKSKLPDLKELASMSSKLFTDIKKSVGEIVHTYKENRAQNAESESIKPVKETKSNKVEQPVETTSSNDKKE